MPTIRFNPLCRLRVTLTFCSQAISADSRSASMISTTRPSKTHTKTHSHTRTPTLTHLYNESNTYTAALRTPGEPLQKATAVTMHTRCAEAQNKKLFHWWAAVAPATDACFASQSTHYWALRSTDALFSPRGNKATGGRPSWLEIRLGSRLRNPLATWSTWLQP